MKLRSLALFSTLCSAALFAETAAERLQKQVDALGATNMSGTYGAINAPTAQEGEERTSAHFDIVYWHPRAVFNTFYTTTKSVYNNTAIPNDGTGKNNPFGWGWGFRTGIAYRTPYDNWTLGVDYLRLRSHRSVNTAPPGGLVFTTLGNSSTSPNWSGSVAASAKDSNRVTYQSLLASLSRSYFVSKTLSCTPRFGVKASLEKFRENVAYEGTLVGATDNTGRTLTYLAENRYTGLGPQVGFDTHWYLPKGWGVEAGAALYQPLFRLQTTTTQSSTPSNSEVTPLPNTVEQDFKTGIEEIYGHINLAYERFFPRSGRKLNLSLGYEANFQIYAPGWIAVTLNTALTF